ncbi:hypothetical protein HYU92_06750 [Candidatus Curtissbacteria bacterium]|nr:hypothetical protein [Candidatus Curtissbacteria bacterium]
MTERAHSNVGADESIDYANGVIGPSTADVARANSPKLADSFSDRIKRQIAYWGGSLSLLAAACTSAGGEVRATVTATPVPFGVNYGDILSGDDRARETAARLSSNDPAIKATVREEDIIYMNEAWAKAIHIDTCDERRVREVDKTPTANQNTGLIQDRWWARSNVGVPIRTKPEIDAPKIGFMPVQTELKYECRVGGPIPSGGTGAWRRLVAKIGDQEQATWAWIDEIRDTDPNAQVARATATAETKLAFEFTPDGVYEAIFPDGSGLLIVTRRDGKLSVIEWRKNLNCVQADGTPLPPSVAVTRDRLDYSDGNTNYNAGGTLGPISAGSRITGVLTSSTIIRGEMKNYFYAVRQPSGVVRCTLPDRAFEASFVGSGRKAVVERVGPWMTQSDQYRYKAEGRKPTDEEVLRELQRLDLPEK